MVNVPWCVHNRDIYGIRGDPMSLQWYNKRSRNFLLSKKLDFQLFDNQMTSKIEEGQDFWVMLYSVHLNS